MSKYSEVRERIALILADTNSWDSYDQVEKNHFIVKAQHVLDDPDILIKAENQELPECLEGNRPRAKAFNNMLKAGWVKTEKKEG